MPRVLAVQSRPVSRLALVVAAVVSSVVFAPMASASFPGTNGKLYYYDVVNGNFDVYSVNPDGSNRARLTTDPAFDVSAVASPDGTRIAFTSDRTGVEQVWTMDRGGGGVTQVSTDGVDERGFISRVFSWSPDGRIYYSNHDQVIVSVNPDGSGRALTGVTGFDLAVSPSGRRIAHSRPSATIGSVDLWVSDVDGGNAVRVTTNPAFTVSVNPEWSPDGARIAFSQMAPLVNRQNIGVATTTGSAVTALTTGPNDYGPQWSPDGTKIAFVDGANRTFSTVDSDGRNRTPLGASPGGPGVSMFITDWATDAPKADAAVTLTATTAPVGYVDYTIGVTNNGPSPLTSAAVVLTLPNTVTALAAPPPGCTSNARTITCTIGPLQVATATQRTIRATIGLLTIGQFTATATRTTGTPTDPRPTNDTATATCSALTSAGITC
ncbi:hypothetical protein [Actinokineospora globicatena]|uniref:DUF11 domain-containing protein n=1 Tax=Actinokineospora globicatena TaxID=103729 RepID=A0A9W6VBW1_9PSEU|nr:hypothetical protein [Actinokineospora globicatena]GLW93363.1 hypothetical protein Aglo03_41790 [Actinokineospora globicatena]